MGFERFFGGKKSVEDTEKKQPKEAEEKSVISRRELLFGGAALLGVSALRLHRSEAGSSEVLHPITTAEDREHNVEKVRRYEQWLLQNKEKLAASETSTSEIGSIIFRGVPALEQSVLQGTELDHEAFFMQNGSWPSIQVREETDDGGQHLRFGHQPNIEIDDSLGYGNAFIAGGVMVTNWHVSSNQLQMETTLDDLDISGRSAHELLASPKSPLPFGSLETTKEDIEQVELQWDRRKMQEDLHGQTVFITSIHEQRGEHEENNRDITPGTLIKITPNMIVSKVNPDAFMSPFFEYGDEKIDCTQALERSYMCIIASRDVNKDNASDVDDVTGISGSPVFTDADCKGKRMMPSGIAWGASGFDDTENKVSYTVAFLFGPDVVGEMIDIVNTIVSKEMDEKVFPQKQVLTSKVQKELVSFGYDLEQDGVYGEKTENAVAAFQRSVFSRDEMESSIIEGTIDRKTWEVLFMDDSGEDKQKLYASFGYTR